MITRVVGFVKMSPSACLHLYREPMLVFHRDAI